MQKTKRYEICQIYPINKWFNGIAIAFKSVVVSNEHAAHISFEVGRGNPVEKNNKSP